MSVIRAKRFLNSKFGPDRYNGNGIARLLEEYRLWIDPDEDNIDTVMHFAKETGLTEKSRVEQKVDGRLYLYVYLTCKFNLGPSEIARLFDLTHASILNALGDYDWKHNEPRFLSNTHHISSRFFLDPTIASAIIKAKRSSTKNKFTNLPYSNFTDPNSKRITLVNLLINRDNLKDKGQYKGRSFRRWYVWNVLKGMNWSYKEIADHFGFKSKSPVYEGIIKFNDEEYRRQYSNIIAEYDAIFKDV